ncbi:complex I intermediate-associated protein 30, mitochondrial [Apis cerana]|uniref:Complex I intermediate-associated protein n=1 Tax=Apis cerana cerana TaxID=94128 RepID=A0A2A3ERI9_APICC|nr:complex I intermediate-associated protein 30, mitochondrial [Apis cerana]PBC33826.1 complex I intermediate-associated protein [Apis cerana cerana]
MEKSIFRLLKSYFRNSLTIKRFYKDYKSDQPIYDRITEDDFKNLSFFQKIERIYCMYKDECKLFIREALQNYSIYPRKFIENEIDIVWKFDGSQKSLDQWIVNSDSDYKYGYSSAKLELSSHGYGIFHGILNTTPVKDGITTDSGYCNITTIPKFKSFYRIDKYDWSEYNEIVLRVKGDGRTYMLNILQKGTQFKNFTYHYFMYTRGGPHWQIVRIPFSKFVVCNKGQINENQYRLLESTVTNFGITIADKIPGSFKLEIDYIGVCYNTNISENFAYEMYDVNRN